MVSAGFRRWGEPLWPDTVSVPGAVWAVNIPLDRQLVVAALGDGTLRWYRLGTAPKCWLSLFIRMAGAGLSGLRKATTMPPPEPTNLSAGTPTIV